MRFEVRRRWSRLAFCLVCLIPTVIITGAVAVTHNPFYMAARQAAWESQWSDRLGLTVKVQSLEQRGGDWVIHGLELRDPETDHWVLRAASIEIAKTETAHVVLVNQSELCATLWPRVWAILHEHVLQRPYLTDRNVMISAATLTMRYERQAESLSGVRCELVGKVDSTEALFEFRMPGNVGGEPARFSVIRNRQLQPPTTAWELHTGDAALPCSLAIPWIPSAARLGPNCTFAGMIWAEKGIGDWTADLSGIFRPVQLEQLVTSQFPHKLSGEGDLTLTRVCLHHGRIVELAGNLQARDGVVSRSLLTAARDELKLRLRDPLRDTSLLRYDQLAVGFTLSSTGMALAGQMQPETTVMSDADGPLLSDSGQADQLSTVALLRFLVPQNEVHVPATEETVSLVRVLPLPQAGTATTADQSSRSYTPVRLLD